MERDICTTKLNSIINDLDISQKIENSIYQYAIQHALKKKISDNFTNSSFKRIYVNIYRKTIICEKIQLKTYYLKV